MAFGRSSLTAIVVGMIALDVAVQALHITNLALLYERSSVPHSRIAAAYVSSYFIGGAAGSALGALVYSTAGWTGVCTAGVVDLRDHHRRGIPCAASIRLTHGQPGPASTNWNLSVVPRDVLGSGFPPWGSLTVLRSAASGASDPEHLPRRMAMTALHTVGHGTLLAEAFAELLDGAHVGRVVDIRSFPGSRHNPQYGRERWSAGCRWRDSATCGCETWAGGADR